MTTNPDQPAQPAAVAPTHLSYSALSTFAQCGKQFQLQRVLNLESEPRYYFAGGSAVHEASEAFDRWRFATLGK